jgi:hypothetical protein
MRHKFHELTLIDPGFQGANFQKSFLHLNIKSTNRPKSEITKEFVAVREIRVWKSKTAEPTEEPGRCELLRSAP